ncbi:MAG: ribonuclease R [Saprospiraceae bacterium]|nr:ribonuclease R [Saprospiraceae bacterium]
MKIKKYKGQKVSKKNLAKVIRRFFRKNTNKTYSARQVLKKTKVANSKNDVARTLEYLEKQGEVRRVTPGKYASANGPTVQKDPKPQSNFSGKQYEGVVDMTRTGAAFIICDELENDVYVSSKNLKGALDKDRVKVEVYKKKNKRRREGRVVSIVERNKQKYTGVFRAYKNHDIVFVDHAKSSFDIVIANASSSDIQDFDRAIVEVTDWPQKRNQMIKGKITEVLGKAGSNDAEMKAILINNGFELGFSEEVMNESKGIREKAEIVPQEGRLDLRDVPTLTIDPEDAKDFDDALSLKYLEDGNIEIGIHIADVSEYVNQDSALDKAALKRGNSVYLVDRVLPMLPEALSNDLCSLRPEEDKYCFSVLVKFSKEGKIVDHKFTKSIICSDRRFTYAEAEDILKGANGPLKKEMLEMNRIAGILREERFKTGSIGFETDEVKIELDDEGKPVEIYLKETGEANLMIEDFMLLANRLVAAFIANLTEGQPIPFPYRIHDQPDPAKLHDFVLLAAESGINFDMQSEKSIADSFNKLMEMAKDDEKLKPLVPMAIRSMAKAEYSTENIGHFGLGFEYYCHFTSPIRRYADLLVHRILHKCLQQPWRMNKDKVDAICNHISSQERKAMDAERESVKYKQAEYMSERVGESYTGVVTGIIDRGFFVVLEGNYCEGMVAFESLDESYAIDALYASMTGRDTGRKIKLGDEVNVVILQADVWNRRIEMTLGE